MCTSNNHIDALIPHLFRQEYAKITAVLSRYFGLQHMEAAEDIASETFLKAAEYWAVHGVPASPAAWLYTVAKNKARDYLKRHQLFETSVKTQIRTEEITTAAVFEFSEEVIADSLLSMLFVVCDPVNTPSTQICLALQILCGFSVEEIAGAFLSNRETIKKRLHRGRVNLRAQNFQLRALGRKEVDERLDTVLKTIYLLFNEGYFSQNEKEFIRKDLCAEAMRLALLLVENSLTDTPAANALLSLICFQSSRLNARINSRGEAVLYEDQDRELWDQFLIEKGNYYLRRAFTEKGVSTYHFEAGIAYWHTTPGEEKWPFILQLYNQLVMLEYSPVTAINRAFAFAKVYGNERAIGELERLQLTENSYYQGLMGFLHSELDVERAVGHYEEALRLTRSVAEKRVLAEKIAELKGRGVIFKNL